MKRLSVALLVLLFATTPRAQQPAPPEIPFESVANFFKLPADMNFGEASGVAVNSKSHVFVSKEIVCSQPSTAAASSRDGRPVTASSTEPKSPAIAGRSALVAARTFTARASRGDPKALRGCGARRPAAAPVPRQAG